MRFTRRERVEAKFPRWHGLAWFITGPERGSRGTRGGGAGIALITWKLYLRIAETRPDYRRAAEISRRNFFQRNPHQLLADISHPTLGFQDQRNYREFRTFPIKTAQLSYIIFSLVRRHICVIRCVCSLFP